MRLLSVFALLILLSGCEGSKAPNTVPVVDTIPYIAESYSMQHGPFRPGGPRLKLEKRRIRLAALPRDTTAAKIIQQTLDTSLDSVQAPVARDFWKLEPMASPPTAGSQDATDAIPANALNWESKATTAVRRNDKQVIAFRLDFYQYTGGEHPHEWREYLDFSPRTGQRLTLADLFRPEALEAEVRPMAAKAFRETYERSIGRETGSPAPREFRLTENFLLTRDTLYFRYNPSEVPPYVAGPLEFGLPVSALRGAALPDCPLAP